MDIDMDNRSVAGTNITQHEEKFRVYNEALIHSASCSDIQCPSNDGRCIKIKASITHFVQCYGPRRKTSPIESCHKCSRIWGLLCYHAKYCPVPTGHHCIVSQCDYLRDKIAHKQQQDQLELQHAQNVLQTIGTTQWPMARRVAQVEMDRQQVLHMIEQIRIEKAKMYQDPSMLS